MKQTKPYVWGRQKAERLLKIDFIRFGIVGVVGFLVTLILKVTIFKTLEVYVALFLSSEGGVLSNFIFHEKWTYNHVDHHNKSVSKKFLHFQLSSLAGVLIVTIISGVGVNHFHLTTFMSLVIAAAVAMFWNFFWTKFFIFNGTTPAILLDPEDTVPMKD
jgi:putative flippase GtrA